MSLSTIDENLAWSHLFASLMRIQAELRRIYGDEFLTVRVGCDDLVGMLTFHAAWGHAKGGKRKVFNVTKEELEKFDGSIAEYVVFMLSPDPKEAPLLDQVRNILKDHPAREDRRGYKWLIGQETYVQLAKMKHPLDLGGFWVIEMRGNTPFMRGIEVETVPGSGIDLLPKIAPMGWDGPNAPTRSD